MLTANTEGLGDPRTSRLTRGSWPRPASGRHYLEALEQSLVVEALERSGWNQTKAATLLGLNRDQIRYPIEKFDLHKT